MFSPIKIKDIHQCEDTNHIYAVVRTNPRSTHVVHAGDLVPAGTMLVTPDIVILSFERRYPKQNSVIRLKSNILAPQIFLAPPNFWTGYASDRGCAFLGFQLLSIHSRKCLRWWHNLRINGQRHKCTGVHIFGDANHFCPNL